ncbi:MAG: RluA family pseudouridine synthase [Thermodesulfobacteriota bacterium]
MPQEHLLIVPNDAIGKRIDLFLAEAIPGMSRSHAAGRIKDGHVWIDDVPVRKSGIRLRPGEIVRVRIPDPVPIEPRPEVIPLDVLYEDDHLLVINKQPGLVVHPAPGHFDGTLVNAVLHHCDRLSSIGGCIRPGIVHRLDKDTSGVLIVTKTDAAQTGLSCQFASRQVQKTYLALVLGRMPQPDGRIELPIGRHPVDRKKMSVRANRARNALTLWHEREVFTGISLLEIEIKTGRTHQIRVHVAAMGHPVAGDVVYGGRPPATPSSRWASLIRRPMLHAWKIGFIHPVTGQPMACCAPLAPDMEAVLTALREIDSPSAAFGKNTPSALRHSGAVGRTISEENHS